MRKIKVGITHGDINGVGYEVILKTFQNEQMFELCTPVLYGSPKVATYHGKAMDIQTNFVVKESGADAEDNALNIVNCFGDEELKVDLGRPTADAGNAAYIALEKSLEELGKGDIDVLVTAPINKNTIQCEGFKFPGHTEYIEQKMGDGDKSLMILANDRLRVALVTTHVPVSKISESITKELICEKLEILDLSLKKDYGIDNPRIAVLSLNPHCGDDGLLGSEEKDVILPAIEEMTSKGVKCFGPYAADGFFGSGSFKLFDAVLAMYHDQGLAPFKALAMEDGVNYTAGLPVVRTSPAHGTAYDIAGKGVADESSFRQAVYSALDIVRNRLRYESSHAHPLKKQYYEKRDDSDKLKLDQVNEDDF